MFVLRVQLLISILFSAIIWVIPVAAQDTSMDSMLDEIDQRLKNNFLRKEAIDAGRERAVLCQSCHGEDGNSKQPEVPNLAGQKRRLPFRSNKPVC